MAARRRADSCEPLNHPPRVRAAINQMPRNISNVLRGPTIQVLLNRCQQPVEQVEPAMDIAHSIGAVTARRLREVLLLLASIEHGKA